jgi:hypothetical protein
MGGRASRGRPCNDLKPSRMLLKKPDEYTAIAIHNLLDVGYSDEKQKIKIPSNLKSQPVIVPEMTVKQGLAHVGSTRYAD